jgi:formylmethanofuran dehydrogenase subunit C
MNAGSEDSLGGATLLRLRAPLTLPVEAECITPDRFIGLSATELAALPVLCGRRWWALGEIFSVSGDGAAVIVLEGDLSHVKRIGQGMTQGRITIHGNVGLHLGTRMSGGEIVVYGHVGAWAGAQMTGGMIRVHGNAGSLLGGTYPGEARGMSGGTILVQGNAGSRAAERMRRGLIAVQGNVGEFAGARMIAGSLLVCGTLGPRAGAGMRRGSIIALGGLGAGLLPTFRYACRYHPTFLPLFLRQLQEWGLPVTPQQVEGLYCRYTGDITTVGKGEILVYDKRYASVSPLGDQP